MSQHDTPQTAATTKRFCFVQQFEDYTDYDTALGGNDAAAVPGENVRRLTIASDHAYLTMADYSEQIISHQAAALLLEEEERRA